MGEGQKCVYPYETFSIICNGNLYTKSNASSNNND